MSFKDGREYNRGTRCKIRGGEWPNVTVEVGERPSTRSTTPSPLRMPLNSPPPPPPRTFPTFGIMEPRASARPRVLAVISRLFGFITVAAIIEKFSRASRPPSTVFPLCARMNSPWSFQLKRFFIRHKLSPFWELSFYDIKSAL